jgi:hypothetical protein
MPEGVENSAGPNWNAVEAIGARQRRCKQRLYRFIAVDAACCVFLLLRQAIIYTNRA